MGRTAPQTPWGETSLTLYDVLIHPSDVKHREFVDLHKRQEIINICIAIDSNFPLDESFVLRDNTGNIRRIFYMLDYYF